MAWLAFVLVAAAVASRLIPHPPNFAPLAAIGLFAAAVLPRPRGAVVAIATLLVSDAIIGFYSPVSMFWTYAGLAANLVLGDVLLRERRSALKITFATLVGALAFFALSNFGVWADGQIWPRTLAGLGQCFTAALPFFRNTLASNVLVSSALFGAWALASRLAARRAAATQHA